MTLLTKENKEIIMEQIWKCGFCNVKEMESGTLNKHERDCRLNPKNKLWLKDLRRGNKSLQRSHLWITL